MRAAIAGSAQFADRRLSAGLNPAARWSGVLLVVLAVATAVGAGDRRADVKFLTGSEFARELEKPLSVSREQAELRDLLERLSSERRIAIVLDRRIDPGQQLDVQLPPLTVRASIEAIAERAGAIVRVVGDTLIVGPEQNLGQLRTICVLRGIERDAFGEALGRRRFKLAQTHSLAWNDLDRPADVVQRIADAAELRVAGSELIPHDLWAAGAIAEMTAAEALSWALVQYDLAFRWTDAAQGIEIVPLADSVAVTRDLPVRRITAAEALQRVRSRFPELKTEVAGRTLTATGLIEDLEIAAVLARGEKPAAAPKAVDFGPLANRRFTLRVVRQSATAVLESLRRSGIDVQVDDALLLARQIDLSAKISLDLKQATIQEMVAAICTPAGATFEVDGETVRIPARE